MAFVRTTIEVGDTVETTREIESCSGKFEIGSIVKITGIGDRGYDIEDEHGNRIIECGWDCVKKI